jgi:succinate dehydrogenase/fumarate reductase flavoprotein subunit
LLMAAFVQGNASCDVLVIGAGGAGLAAAIEAASTGARVIVLEKNPRPGGTTSLSVGSITATQTPHQLRHGIPDSPAQHAEDLAKINARRGLPDNPALRRVLTENITDTFRWLLDLGVEFIGPLPEPPHRHPRMHCVLPTARTYISRFVERAEALGVDIRCGFSAQSLLTDHGQVVGVAGIRGDGAAAEIRARATVLATGDFSGNADMIERYVSAHARKAVPVNPTNTGDGHRMAMGLGARLLNGQVALVTIRFLPPKRPSVLQSVPPSRLLGRIMRIGYERLPEWLIRPFVMAFITSVLQPAKGIYQAGAILVNRDGQRFGEETGDLTLALTQQRDGVAFLLFDRRIAERFSRWPDFVSTAPGAGYAYVPDYRLHRRDLWHQEQTIEALAGSLAMPAEALRATVADYNKSVAGSERLAMLEPPFCALGPLTTVLVFTDGGLAIDAELLVLGDADKPIPGLYAAGSVGQGGMLLDGHGHHIGWAFTSGRLAGRKASAFAGSAL